MEKNNLKKSIPKSIPPKIGEFGYYDSIYSKQERINIPHWIVKTSKGNYAVHYSSTIDKKFQKFISNAGIIISINKQIGNFPKKKIIKLI